MSDAIAAGMDGTGQTVAVIDAFASPTMDRDLRKYSVRHGLPQADLTQYNVPLDRRLGYRQSAGVVGRGDARPRGDHSLAPGAKLVFLGARDNSGRGLLERFEFAVDGSLAPVHQQLIRHRRREDRPSGFAAWEAVFQQAAAMGIGSYFSSGDCGDNMDPGSLCGGTGYITDRLLGVEPVGHVCRRDEPRGRRSGPVPVRDRLGTTASYLGNNRWMPQPPGQYRYGSGGGTSGLFAEPAYQVGFGPDALATRWNGPEPGGSRRGGRRAIPTPGSLWTRPRRSRAVPRLRRISVWRDEPVVPAVRGDHGARRPSEGDPQRVAAIRPASAGGERRVPRHRRSALADGGGPHGLRANFLNPHQGPAVHAAFAQPDRHPAHDAGLRRRHGPRVLRTDRRSWTRCPRRRRTTNDQGERSRVIPRRSPRSFRHPYARGRRGRSAAWLARALLGARGRGFESPAAPTGPVSAITVSRRRGRRRLFRHACLDTAGGGRGSARRNVSRSARPVRSAGA